GRRREAIASFERAAHRRPCVAPLAQFDDAPRRVLVEDRGEHAVVGRDEFVVPRVGGDAPARRTDAWIDDDEEDRAGRKEFIRSGELQRACKHVVRRNVVRDVDERHVGADAERDAFHRAGVMVARAEIGQQCDDRSGHVPSLSNREKARRTTRGRTTTAELAWTAQVTAWRRRYRDFVDSDRGRYAGFRNRISRRLFCSRKESETRRPENNRMMSRLRSLA